MLKKRALYIVATPIGNPEDITLRALKVLAQVNAIICEETRQAGKLLKQIGISGKDLIPLNEHNEREQIFHILTRLNNDETLALISDCGTPLFSDPGTYLLHQVIDQGFTAIPVPGPSSLMTALSIVDVKYNTFVYGGFLPQKTEMRIPQLKYLQSLKMPLVLLDTPYRLGKLLQEVEQVFGKQQRATLACDLTLPSEEIFRGDIQSIKSRVGNRKSEFVLIIHEPTKKISISR